MSWRVVSNIIIIPRGKIHSRCHLMSMLYAKFSRCFERLGCNWSCRKIQCHYLLVMTDVLKDVGRSAVWMQYQCSLMQRPAGPPLCLLSLSSHQSWSGTSSLFLINRTSSYARIGCYSRRNSAVNIAPKSKTTSNSSRKNHGQTHTKSIEIKNRVSLNRLARLKKLVRGFPGAPLTKLLVEIFNIDFLGNHWSFEKISSK